MQISKNFILQEFVPKAIFQQFGKNSLWFLDSNLINAAQFVRDYFGMPMKVNNWYHGGVLQNRGFRPYESTTGGKLSQHRFGRALDFTLSKLSASNAYKEILLNQYIFRAVGITAIEDVTVTPGHCHIDLRQSDNDKILIIKP